MFFFMLVCLVSIVLGNVVFHFALPNDVIISEHYLIEHFSFQFDKNQPVSQFLWKIILFSRKDLFVVFLVSVSFWVAAQRSFLCLIFTCRSFHFGFCGAYIISSVAQFDTFLRGCFFWFLFFVRHIAILSVLLCFGEAILSYRRKVDFRSDLLYFFTICGEIALVIFLNTVYFFIISII